MIVEIIAPTLLLALCTSDSSGGHVALSHATPKLNMSSFIKKKNIYVNIY